METLYLNNKIGQATLLIYEYVFLRKGKNFYSYQVLKTQIDIETVRFSGIQLGTY